jgi:hypothetical protein
MLENELANLMKINPFFKDQKINFDRIAISLSKRFSIKPEKYIKKMKKMIKRFDNIRSI